MFLSQFNNPHIVARLYRWARYLPAVYLKNEKPAHNVEQLLDRVGDDAVEHLGWTWLRSDVRRDLIKLLEIIEDSGSVAYAKELMSVAVVTADPVPLPIVPATDKQVAYLKRLGVKEFKGSKSEASVMIEKLKAGG